MFDSLLPTKLYLPPIRADWVQRPRLLGKLDRNSQTKLILVSAPAGYGKTTLVTAWLRQLEGAEICWLSLDENDSDPQHFFRYLAAAVRPLPDVQSQLPPLLQSNQPIPAKTLIKAFTHDVIPVAKPFVLVLDDYHVLDSAEIENALATLLDLMPPQMTLVLTSRSDPGFPISRLRARGELVELRADDLRFTEMEAAQFLQQTMGLTLQPAQVAALENRTEGWIAGLQMAALSLQNRSNSDLDSFVDTFTGSHRFVIDYLVEETLLHQPDAVRTFLLATAVLERLSGPLCAAVTQMPHAQEILEMLERNNLFVVPLDEQRHWYRYHHLFADVLRAYAHDRQPAQIALWHQRASDWFAAQDALSDALPHAFAAQNFAEAARLLELIRSQIGGSYQFRQWLRWADRLPADLLQNRPVLAAGYGWALLFFGEMAASQPYFAQAEQAVTEPAPDQIVYDLEQWRLMPALLANARAYRLMSEGDVVGASQYARQARDFFGPGQEHHYWRQAALSLLDLTHWFTGDIPAAADAFAQSTESRLQAGVVVDAISTAMVLAEFQITLGNLWQAEETVKRLLKLAIPEDGPLPLGTDDLFRLLAYLAWERGEEETAVAYMDKAVQAAEIGSLTNGLYRQRLLQVALAKSDGAFDRALALLEEAESLYMENPLPLVRSIPALRADIWIAQGDLARAGAWAAAAQLSSDSEVHYLHEFTLSTFVRLQLALFHRDGDSAVLNGVAGLMARLVALAETGERMGSVLQLLLLQAQLLAAQQDEPAALAALSRALALAEPEGYLQTFVREGAPLARLLETAIKSGNSTPYAQRLLASYAPEKLAEAEQPLLDPLSERELEIMQLIAAGLKNKEIAEQLFISLNTVLYHNKNIYSKLGVSKRTVAVSKARELGLV